MPNTKVHLPTYFERKAADESKKKKVIIFSGSSRSSKNCSGGDGKTLTLAKLASEAISKDASVEIINLAVEEDGLVIQPCKACISTAGGYQCHFPCSCYGKAKKETDVKDLMYEADIYKNLEECDGFIVYTPINWYAPSTPVKALFDRLVCASGTLPAEFAMKELGKDPKKTIPAYQDGIYDDKLKNWLEGKYAAFFIHGDDGADDFKRLPPPDSFNRSYDKEVDNPIRAIAPIVATCRYMGINVPDDLILGTLLKNKMSYVQANQKFEKDMEEFKAGAVDLAKKLVSYINK